LFQFDVKLSSKTCLHWFVLNSKSKLPTVFFKSSEASP
jgi:hypothetical protein